MTLSPSGLDAKNNEALDESDSLSEGVVAVIPGGKVEIPSTGS